MEIRNILDKDGNIVGQLQLPDGTPESVWKEKLDSYKASIEFTPSFARMLNIKQRKEFADKLLEEFKEKNIADGINADQGFELQELLAEYHFTFAGRARQIDIMNLSVTGDIELATLALLYGPTHDMSQPYHWFSAERKTWLITRMKAFLSWP